MKTENINQERGTQEKTTKLFIIWQVILVIILMGCLLSGMFIGVRFLNFIDREKSFPIAVTNRWNNAGIEQLQQMNDIIKKELDLIIDQRRENQALQAKIQKLEAESGKISKATKNDGIILTFPDNNGDKN